jgi:hypothetical protein
MKNDDIIWLHIFFACLTVDKIKIIDIIKIENTLLPVTLNNGQKINTAFINVMLLKTWKSLNHLYMR